MLISPQGDEICLIVQLNFKASNNKAEYEALLAGLQVTKHVGTIKFIIHSNSQLAAPQLEGTYETKNDRLRRYTKAYENLKIEF